MWEYTGYNMNKEDRKALRAQCLDFDIMSLSCDVSDLPETRGIKDKMRRDDQNRVNSCAGFGMTNAAEVSFYLKYLHWRQFNPMWAYKRGQLVDGIRGDNGATIFGVVSAAKKVGLLPEDVNDDGSIEYPYTSNYNTQYPKECFDYAAPYKVGYSLDLKGFDPILRFLQTNQGAVVVGGPWGNWKPNSAGIATKFVSGGGGHARAYVDWITIDGVVYLVEANSHYKSYGDNGFAYHSRSFVNSQANDRFAVTIGVSDLSSPEPRVIDWKKELVFVPPMFNVPSPKGIIA